MGRPHWTSSRGPAQVCRCGGGERAPGPHPSDSCPLQPRGGHPVVGDPLYSRCRRLPMALPGQMLHAVELGFNHPLTQERIVCRAELPPCFQRLLRRLRKRWKTPDSSQ